MRETCSGTGNRTCKVTLKGLQVPGPEHSVRGRQLMKGLKEFRLWLKSSGKALKGF